jgi:ketosteroid isomerase-like protein
MSLEETTRIAGEFIARMSVGADPDEIAALFSTALDFEIAGDVGALPWIGRKIGRSAAADLFHDVRHLLQPLRFEIHDILTNDSRAVIVGELASRVKSAGKTVETAFAFVLNVSGGEITRFRMLEDSFAVSRAARGEAHSKIANTRRGRCRKADDRRQEAETTSQEARAWRHRKQSKVNSK